MGASEAIFPAYGEADWRKVAEAALKGASFDRLVSRSADGFPIEPIYPPGDGPRPLGREGAWAVVARVDHPDSGEANAQAVEDLASGADGLQVVFRAAVGSYGFGLKRSDSATLHKVFDGIRFDSGSVFELDLGPDGPAQTLAFAALIERTGARPAEACASFGLDPFAAAALGPDPADGAAHMRPFVEAALALKTQGFRGTRRHRRRASRPRRRGNAGSGARLRARRRREPASGRSERRRRPSTRLGRRSPSASPPTRTSL